MNAPQPLSRFPNPFGEPVTGELLFAGFQMTDTVQVDLYGDLPNCEVGYEVTGVCVSTDQNRTNIVELFSRRQLLKMDEWLDFKDDMSEQGQRIKFNAGCEIVRSNY